MEREEVEKVASTSLRLVRSAGIVGEVTCTTRRGKLSHENGLYYIIEQEFLEI